MIYLYLFGTCFHFIYVFMIIGKVKEFTTFQLRKSLGINEDIWQKGIFDRILRNWDEFEKYVDYIANNPKSLPEDSYSLYIQESIR